MLDWWSENAFSIKPSFPEDGDKPALEIKPRGPVRGPEWGGTHRKSGVLIMRGPPFRRGHACIEGARLVDMAPTLLHLMGQKIPDDMDGRVLMDAFDPEFAQRHSAESCSTADTSGEGGDKSYSTEEAKQIEARLKALGYID